MRKTYLTCISVFSIVFATAQTTKNNGNTNVPVFKTEAEKATWIKNNPEEYKKMGGTVKNTTPEFKNQAEKDAWVAANEKERKESFLKNAESNPTSHIKTEEEKDEWIRKNRDVYEGKSNSPNKVIVSKSEFNALPIDKQKAMLSDSNFIIEK